jgi:hypothetical protein
MIPPQQIFFPVLLLPPQLIRPSIEILLYICALELPSIRRGAMRRAPARRGKSVACKQAN